ncbi:hypothetical protein ONZ45_g17703 [Pleurotus djamor]|nr:hypothetical protein ONZ45_g17703 [Pleurotus djamor]
MSNTSCPIETLPPELLTEILRQTSSRASILSIFALASVSRKWKAAVESDSAIWSNFVIDTQEVLPRALLSPVKTALQRSATRYLTLSVDIHHDSAGSSDLLFLVKLHASQWHDLELRMPFHMMRDLLANTGPLPSLQRLDLIVDLEELSLPEEEEHIDITLANGVRRLKLVLPYELIPPTYLIFPLGLTRCFGAWGTCGQILNFLRSQRDTLIRVSVFYHSSLSTATSTGDSSFCVRLPELQTLHITVGEPPVNLDALLSNLALPSLKELKVSLMEDPLLGSQEDAFDQFLRRHPWIKRLVFKDSFITNKSLVRFSRSVPDAEVTPHPAAITLLL